MTVVIAYPYEGHRPGDTVELDPKVEKRLVHAGVARYADASSAAEAATEPVAPTVTSSPQTPAASPETVTQPPSNPRPRRRTEGDQAAPDAPQG